MVDLFAYGVIDPGHVGRWASEHAGLFVHDAADWPEAGDSVDFPGGRGCVLTHEGTTWVSLWITDNQLLQYT